MDRAVARIHAARARLEALERNRVGDYDGARRAVRGVARRIVQYAGEDTALNALAAQLVAEESALVAPMPALQRKSMHFDSHNVQRSRDVSGRAQR